VPLQASGRRNHLHKRWGKTVGVRLQPRASSPDYLEFTLLGVSDPISGYHISERRARFGSRTLDVDYCFIFGFSFDLGFIGVTQSGREAWSLSLPPHQDLRQEDSGHG
jgi:hypothetical protein